MRKYLVLCVIIYTLITLVGCGTDKKNVAVLLYDRDDPFIDSVGELLEGYNTEDYNITVYDSKRSQILQNDMAEKLFEEVDVMVINPVERLSSYIFVEKSIQQDVPVIFFNREPLHEDLQLSEQVFYVGAKATESGIMQADMIAELFGNDPVMLNELDLNQDNVIQCVIFKGEQGHQDAEERTVAVIDALNQKGFEVDVLFTEIANWNENEAYRDMKEIMEIHGRKIELLISNNDAMAIGAIKFLKDNGYFGPDYKGYVEEIPFPIVGIDGLEEAKDLIKNGYMYGTILNDGTGMADAIIELSLDIMGGSNQRTSYELVDDKYIWIPYKNYK